MKLLFTQNKIWKDKYKKRSLNLTNFRRGDSRELYFQDMKSYLAPHTESLFDGTASYILMFELKSDHKTNLSYFAITSPKRQAKLH